MRGQASSPPEPKNHNKELMLRIVADCDRNSTDHHDYGSRPLSDDTPRFAVDPFWPKPLPNNWILGQIGGIAVDPDDHIWVTAASAHADGRRARRRAVPPTSKCCAPRRRCSNSIRTATSCKRWGGPGDGYEWPETSTESRSTTKATSGSAATASSRPPGAEVHAAMASSSCRSAAPAKPGTATTPAARPPRPALARRRRRTSSTSPTATSNRRVIVFDADTGQYKRHWGAYGERRPTTPTRARTIPTPPIAKQFRNPVHCVRICARRPRLCLRPREQSHPGFPEGRDIRVRVHPRARDTLFVGSVWDIGFSEDPEQKYLYVADGTNSEMHILLRNTGETLASFGRPGRQNGAIPLAAQRSRWTRRATSTRVKSTPASGFRSSAGHATQRQVDW